MTRINCVSVHTLTDQHLLAEYREITRVSKLAKELKYYGKYCMGTGHVKFFYNKGAFLKKRTEQLYLECVARGFKVQYKEYTLHPGGSLNNDWLPTDADKDINRERLLEKIRLKPDFYRYFGDNIYT